MPFLTGCHKGIYLQRIKGNQAPTFFAIMLKNSIIP